VLAMVGKSEIFTMTSGVTPILSGLVNAFSIDGQGTLRHLYVGKGENSGNVRLVVYSDNGLILDGQAIFYSGVVMSNVDVVGTSLFGSGAALISGTAITVESIGFTENLTLRYSVDSGSVTIRGILDLNKRLIQT
jgi:hypothetical protein